MKSAATYLRKIPERNFAICRRMASETMSWLRQLDAKNRSLVKAMSVGVTTDPTDGVKIAIMNDFILSDDYTVLDGSKLLESFHSLCASLRGCVPKGEEFVVYFRNNGTAWDIYADTGLGGTETVERFTNWSTDYPQKTSEVFELTIHNLEEPT